VYAKAKECSEILSAEDFAILLAKHFTSFYRQVGDGYIFFVFFCYLPLCIFFIFFIFLYNYHFSKTKGFSNFLLQVTTAIVKIVEKPWERVSVDGQPHEHG
jgi:urate oxidase